MVVVLIGAGIAVYLTAVWHYSESKATRAGAILAVVASVVLVVAAGFNSLCGIAENRSELFNERCEGWVPYIPLYAIPLLLVAPGLRRWVPGGLLMMMGCLLVTVAIAVPLRLLSV